MDNIRQYLEDAVSRFGEPLEAIVVGRHYDKMYDDDPALPDENVILSVEDGLKKVDQDYEAGYGGADCFPIYAWSKSRVFFIKEYDGATILHWVPRHPIAIAPNFSGEPDDDAA